jgi:serine/threonine protein kinase
LRLTRGIFRVPPIIQSDGSRDSVFLVRPKLEHSLLEFTVYQQPRLHASEKLWIIYQLLTSVFRLHAVGLAHRDIKPSKVFIGRSIELGLLHCPRTAGGL